MLRKICRSLLLLVGMICALASGAHDAGLRFIPNLGQWEHPGRYQTSFNGGTVFLESQRFTYSFLSAESVTMAHALNQASAEEKAQAVLHGHAWHMAFENAQQPELSGKRATDFTHNYFLGNQPDKWRSNVSVYQAVHYAELYPDIDLFVHSSEGNFKYDFWVEPGADPSLIALRFDGLNSVSLSTEGTLELETSIGLFVEGKPFAYQLIDNQLHEVPCNYVWRGETIGFHFPEGFDPAHRLIIDPELIAATLSGSTGENNYGHCAAFDADGNIFTAATSYGPGYPTGIGSWDQTFNGGATDWALSKLNPEGSNLLWATYLGGGFTENPHCMITNAAGELFVFGTTNSPDFPALPGSYQPASAGSTDMAVARISADGATLMGCTYVGGSGGDGNNLTVRNYGDAFRGEIILTPAGEPLVITSTSSADFPVTANAYQTTLSGMQDALLYRLNADLTALEFATFIGGSDIDSGYGVRVGLGGELLISGSTESPDFPSTAGAYQTTFLPGIGTVWADPTNAYVAVLSPDGSALNAATFIGTEGWDQAFFLDTDSEGNVWIFGQCGTGWPEVGTGYSSGPNSTQFVTALPLTLDVLLRSFTVGTGTGDTEFAPIAFMVDECDRIFISGHSSEPNLPVSGDALHTGDGFYLAAYTPEGQTLEYSTYYTGDHVDGGTSRFDESGIIYQGVCNTDGGFSATPDAWDDSQTEAWDVGVFKIDFQVPSILEAASGHSVPDCAPFEVAFTNTSSGGTWEWDFGDGATSTEFEPTHLFEDAGTYEISLIVSDPASCMDPDTAFFDVVIPDVVEVEPSFDLDVDCSALSVSTTNLTGDPSVDYVWDMGDGTQLTELEVEHTFAQPGDYTVSLTAMQGVCALGGPFEMPLTLVDLPSVSIPLDSYSGCAPVAFDAAAISVSGEQVTWDFGDGNGPVSNPPTEFPYADPGMYQVVVTATSNPACPSEAQDSAWVEVLATPVVNALFLTEQTGTCTTAEIVFTNQSVGTDLDYVWDFGNGSSSEEAAPPPLTYDSTGPHTVSLTVTDPVCGVQDSHETEVTVLFADPPVPAFTVTTDCPQLTVSTINTTVDSGYEYTWNMGDGTELYGLDVVHTYENPGDFEVSLAVSHLACNYLETLVVPVTLEQPPSASVALDNYSGCAPLLFEAEEVQADGWEVTWTYGDGSTGTQPEDYVYTEPGTYLLMVTATGGLNCPGSVQDSAWVEVLELPQVQALFDAQQNGPCADAEVVITNLSVGQNLLYDWDYGNGAISSDPDPLPTTYDSTGPHTISLTVTDPICGVQDSFDAQIELEEAASPSPAFTLISDCPTLTVTTNNSTEDAGYNYQWNMGDGITLEGFDVEHTYSESGDFTVVLTVTHLDCDVSEMLAVPLSLSEPPVVSIAQDSYLGCPPLVIDATEIEATGAGVDWDFGDGTTTDQPGDVVYTEPGEYLLVVSAEGGAACPGTAQDSAWVQVLETPVVEALFDVTQSGPCENLEVDITDQSSGDGLAYYWDFGNGTTSVDETPGVVTYVSPGTYTVSLLLSGGQCGAGDAFSTEITLLDGLVVETPAPVNLCPNVDQATLTGPDLGPGGVWTWETGETTQSIEVDQPGTYSVTVGTNSCSGSVDFTVVAIEDAYEVREWTACEGTQTVVQINAEGTDYTWCTGEVQDFIVASEEGEYCYYYTDVHGCLQEGLVILTTIDQDALLYVPNAFTPNQDGVNDVFIPVGEPLKEYHLTIWNRWGEAMFESFDQNEPWVGDFQGGTHYVQDEVYTYRIDYMGQCNAETVTKIGTVTIVR